MISVFTPLSPSGNGFIRAAWETLKAQTYTDWEWVVLPNYGGAASPSPDGPPRACGKLPKDIADDPRVRVIAGKNISGVGALKRECCLRAKGDVFFELDHDDLLHEDALKEVALAIEAGADFCVSDFAEFHSGSWAPNTYRADCGWTSYPVTFQGHELLAMPNPELTAHNMRDVAWAPNHLRAWRATAYWRAGGHDASFPVIDDHDLLVRGFLAGLKYVHIPRCLYFYRLHDKQTVPQRLQQIRALTWQVYNRYIFELAEKFARDNCLERIDLCGGIDCPEGYTPLDHSLGHDLNEIWPLDSGTVGVLRAYDAIEHLTDPIHTMNEAYRVLAPGGFFLIRVPSTDGRGAFQDPTHVSFWNENSFWYYTRAEQARYVAHAGSKARFQVAKLITFFPSPWHEEHKIPYVEVHLIALKDGFRPMGEVGI